MTTSRLQGRVRKSSEFLAQGWCAELAAIYCGEPNIAAFLKRVGKEYPQPRVNDGRRRLWLRDDLDQAILPPELAMVRDVAEDL